MQLNDSSYAFAYAHVAGVLAFLCLFHSFNNCLTSRLPSPAPPSRLTNSKNYQIDLIKDNYLLQILDKATNCIPDSENTLADMDDQEFGQWLQKQDFREKKTPALDIKVPELTIRSTLHYQKHWFSHYP